MSRFLTIFLYLIARLKEPSTAAGLGAIATGVGMILGNGDPAAMIDGVAAVQSALPDPAAYQTSDYVGAVVSLAGVAAMFLKERAAPPKPPQQ